MVQPSENLERPQFYDFGPFRVDVENRLLLRDGEPVPLTAKVFDILLLFVENNGRMLDKNELMMRIWPESFVEEGNLSRNVSTLRKALGVSPQQRGYIVTVQGYGYRFVADVRAIPGQPPKINPDSGRLKLVQNAEVSEGTIQLNGTGTKYLTPPKDIGSSTASNTIPKLPLRKSIAITLAVCLGLIALLTFIALRFRPALRKGSSQPVLQIAPLTTTGKVVTAAISPDGRYVAYAQNDSGHESLWIRQIPARGTVQIVPSSNSNYLTLTFSPDGNYLYYTVWDRKTPASLYQMPVLGGAAKKLVEDIDSSPAFSPDARQFAFVRGYPLQHESALLIVDADGTNERKLAIRKDPAWFYAEQGGPSWSRDGNTIVCAAHFTDANGSYQNLVGVNVADGSVKTLTSHRWASIAYTAWLRDGSGVIVNASDQASKPAQIWQISYPGGESRRLTNDLNEYRGVSLTADSNALVTLKGSQLSNVWLAADDTVDRTRQITSGLLDGARSMSWTPEGRIVYTSLEGGNEDLWIMDHDGTNRKQLTADAGRNISPSVSADGHHIVFMSDRKGIFHIWRIDQDGGNPTQLTNSDGESFPDCSRYEPWFVYTSNDLKVWKLSLDGGNPLLIIDHQAARPAVSPDGKWIAAGYPTLTSFKTAIFPAAGGEPVKLLNIWRAYFRWTPDSRAVAYIHENQTKLTSQPIDGGPAKEVLNLQADQLFRFAWSRDGKQLALARGTLTSDVILINNLREWTLIPTED